MATIINTPGGANSSIVEIVIGLVAVAGLVVLFIVYAVPALRNMSQPQPASDTTIEVKLPTPEPTPAPDAAPTP